MLSSSLLISGDDKHWIGIPTKYASSYKETAQFYLNEESLICSEFIRHKNTLPTESFLRKMGIPFKKTVRVQNRYNF